MMIRLIVVVLVLISIVVVNSLSLSNIKQKLGVAVVSSVSILGLSHPVIANEYTGIVSIADKAVPSTGIYTSYSSSSLPSYDYE